jgi:hypothetical protein
MLGPRLGHRGGDQRAAPLHFAVAEARDLGVHKRAQAGRKVDHRS